MSIIILERQCPKCNVGFMEYIAIRSGTFRSKLIIEKIMFRCNNCKYVNEIIGHPIGA